MSDSEDKEKYANKTGDVKGNSTTSDVSSFSVKLPPFWTKSPGSWFVQTEAQFAIAKITRDIIKYNYVLAALPQDVLETVLDFIEEPPPLGVYDKFKATLVERHSLSEERRIEKLLSSEEIGDRKPSEFLRSLKQLAGASGIMSDKLIKKLWLRRLPQVINIALISQDDKSEQDLTSLADKIWEASISSRDMSEIRMQSPSNHPHSVQASHDAMKNEIMEMKAMIRSLTDEISRFRQRRRSSLGRQQRRRSTSRNHSVENKVCYYHRRWGINARKCDPPCQFKRSETSRSNDSTDNNLKN